ncbi:ATP-binding protein [Streptomyces sp. NPDC006544]|uniref:sensor histidine kinase n=1 Tax=Streptomyces sp. NPDC006544 TaxID=3154583 RepID=UPI0033A09C1C
MGRSVKGGRRPSRSDATGGSALEGPARTGRTLDSRDAPRNCQRHHPPAAQPPGPSRAEPVGHAVRHHRDTIARADASEGAASSDGVLTVCNTGPVIAPQDVPGLLEPLRRRVERRHAAGEEAGLGFSIVASIARAHGAELTARARPSPGGGLTVRVVFPVASTVGETPGRLTGQPNGRSTVYGRDNEQARPSRLPYASPVPSVPIDPFVLPGGQPVPRERPAPGGRSSRGGPPVR